MSAVNLAPMADRVDHDGSRAVVYRVEGAIRADADAVAVLSLEFAVGTHYPARRLDRYSEKGRLFS